MGRKILTIAVGLTGAAGLAAALAGVGTSAAAPAPQDQAASFESFTFDASDPGVARRLAAGENPATIPGVRLRTGEKPAQLVPSSEEDERRIAAKNDDDGVTSVVDSSTLGDA